MGTLTNYYSLLEQAKRIDPSGAQAQIVEVLNRKMGDILTDAPWLPSNDIWTNKTTRRGTLPTGQKRKLNQRVTNSVSRTTEVMDVMEMIEDYCEIDAKLVDSSPSPAVFRSGEVDAFIEGLGQTFVGDIIYSDSYKDPDSMHGIEARLATPDARFVIDAGGSGSDVTSVIVVTWGQTTAHLIYPKNMPQGMGVKHVDKGRVTSETADGKMEIYRDHFEIVGGMVVRHPRAIGRVGSIEVSGDDNTFNENDLITLLNNMEKGPGTRIYMNEIIATQCQIRTKDKSNVYWQPGNRALAGEPILWFGDVPVRVLSREILLATEDAI